LVFTTRFRHKVFEDRHLRRMEELLRQVCQDFECELLEFNAESEHVHLLVDSPAKVTISKLVNSLKGVSSRMLRQEFRTTPSLLASPAVVERLLLRRLGRWAPLEVLRRYIENRKRPVS
jgi:putative transposase